MKTYKINKRYVDSHGPRGQNKIIGIVIHCISAIEVDKNDPYNIDKIFNILKKHFVSSDYLIDREGHIFKLTPPKRYAYHSGISQMPTGECVFMNNNEPCVNKITIGIELIGIISKDFTKAQYEACAWLSRKLVRKYPHIARDHIVGHEHVAPDRKQDPGPTFDWELFYNIVGL